jgi:hypothetical protein
MRYRILTMVAFLLLSACSPAGIRITEEVIEDVAEKELLSY